MNINKTDSQDVEVREKILDRAEKLFMMHGFTRVTMSEVAQSLVISKKTLYKHFRNKEALIVGMLNRIKFSIIEYVDNLFANPAHSFLEKLKMLLEYIGKATTRMKGPMMEELQQHYPLIYNDIKEFQKKNGLNKFTQLIEEGVKQGVFRLDINTEIIVYIYISAVRELIDPSFLSTSSLSADQVYANITKILFEGILTDSARKEFLSLKPKTRKVVI